MYGPQLVDLLIDCSEWESKRPNNNNVIFFSILWTDIFLSAMSICVQSILYLCEVHVMSVWDAALGSCLCVQWLLTIILFALINISNVCIAY